jgi:hypothetical protein
MNIQKIIETTLNNFLNEASLYNLNDEDVDISFLNDKTFFA